MTPTQFAIVTEAFIVGLKLEAGERDGLSFRYWVDRLRRHLDDVGDRDQARHLENMLTMAVRDDAPLLVDIAAG